MADPMGTGTFFEEKKVGIWGTPAGVNLKISMADAVRDLHT